MTRANWLWWGKHHFLKHLPEAMRPALLIIDGHDSHFDLEFMLVMKAAGVDVVQEPSNCSSVLQALDQVCFQVLKREWKDSMTRSICMLST